MRKAVPNSLQKYYKRCVKININLRRVEMLHAVLKRITTTVQNLSLCVMFPYRFRSFQVLKVPYARKWRPFVIGEDVYFAVASNSRSHDSSVFKWVGDMFAPFQTLRTVKAFDVEPFKIGEDTYLAVAIYYGRGGSHIFKWDGERFVKFQDIAAVGSDIEHFNIDGSTFLAITGELSVRY